MNIQFEYIASDGVNYFIEAEGFVEEDEFDYSLHNIITDIQILNEDDIVVYNVEMNEVTLNELSKDIREELEDEIFTKDFSDY